MKKIRRLTWIRLLMIISQLVLVLFLGKWLTSVYVKERDRFDLEFLRRFQESGMNVLDSMLVEKVLDPLLKDSSYRRLTMRVTMDSTDLNSIGREGTRIYRNGISDSCKSIITITTNEPNLLTNEQIPSTYFKISPGDDVFLQGMKLIVQRIEDSLFLPSGYVQRSVALEDTAKMKKIFIGNIQEIDPSIKIIWTTKTGARDTFLALRKQFNYEMPAPGYTLAASVNNPFLVVLKEIIPSILFALTLVLLTGLSFVIAFRSLKKQIRLNEMRSSFVSNITHELKTPVSTVKVALEALQTYGMKNDPETTSSYLEMAIHEMNRLDLLITKVLQASIYENENYIITKEPADLNRIIIEVMNAFSPRFEREGANVIFNPTETCCLVPVDWLHIQGVLINLLDNCLKYGGVNPQITIQLTRHNNQAILAVTDHGPGIPEAYLGTVFEKFFRIPAGDQHTIKGYGLGLSYAAMVVKQHGGTIRAMNNPEGGVTFQLTLPTGV